jgi:hypothetical protein
LLGDTESLERLLGRNLTQYAEAVQATVNDWLSANEESHELLKGQTEPPADAVTEMVATAAYRVLHGEAPKPDKGGNKMETRASVVKRIEEEATRLRQANPNLTYNQSKVAAWEARQDLAHRYQEIGLDGSEVNMPTGVMAGAPDEQTEATKASDAAVAEATRLAKQLMQERPDEFKSLAAARSHV